MIKKCVSCKSPASYKTNTFYCQKCLLAVLERRIRANIRHILKEEYELINISEQSIRNPQKDLKTTGSHENKRNIRLVIEISHKQDCALAFLLQEFLHDHALKHIFIKKNDKCRSIFQCKSDQDSKTVQVQMNTGLKTLESDQAYGMSLCESDQTHNSLECKLNPFSPVLRSQSNVGPQTFQYESNRDSKVSRNEAERNHELLSCKSNQEYEVYKAYRSKSDQEPVVSKSTLDQKLVVVTSKSDQNIVVPTNKLDQELRRSRSESDREHVVFRSESDQGLRRPRSNSDQEPVVSTSESNREHVVSTSNSDQDLVMATRNLDQKPVVPRCESDKDMHPELSIDTPISQSARELVPLKAQIISQVPHNPCLLEVKEPFHIVSKKTDNLTDKLSNMKLNEKRSIFSHLEPDNQPEIVHLTRYTKEDLATLILDSTIENEMVEMAKYCSDGYQLSDLIVLNVLKSFSDKEISIFLNIFREPFDLFLKQNNLEDNPTARGQEDFFTVIPTIHRTIPKKYKQFIYKMSKKNRATSTNIIETVMKGYRMKWASS